MAGTFCPEGSTQPTTCTPGHFCPNQTSAPVPCQAGTYNPNEGATSNASCVTCDSGHYCVEGSAAPEPCPTGTYTTADGNEDLSFCSTCHAGFYCAIPEGSNTSQMYVCDEGYYCPPGQSAATFRCPPGYFCAEGSEEPEACAPGKYQPFTMQTDSSACLKCPEGYYCASAATSTPEVCTRGHYCASGAKIPTACEAGTYSKFPQQSSIATCDACDEGMACSLAGRSQAGQQCEPGFYCIEGNALSATPDDCGYGENVTNCTVEGRGGGFCYAGYECAAGSSTPEGDADCPENSFCEAGPPGNAQDCPPGTYQSEVGQAGCLQCLPGHFCAPLYFTNGSIALEEARLQPCPNGTYNPAAGSVAIDACLTCPSGSVCGNAANTTQPCPAGYYCCLLYTSPSPRDRG